MQVIQFCDDVMVDAYGGNITPEYGSRLYRAIHREIQESMLTTPNGTEGFEDFEDCDPYMPEHIQIVDEIDLYYAENCEPCPQPLADDFWNRGLDDPDNF